MQDFQDKSPPALRPSPDGRWTLKVSIYPKVSGSISDKDVLADPEPATEVTGVVVIINKNDKR